MPKKELILEIRKMILEGYKLKDIANNFNVNSAIIHGIKYKKTWDWLKENNKEEENNANSV